MIDEKKLIEDLLHNDGVCFEMQFNCTTPEDMKRSLDEYTNKLKEGIVNLIKSQPSFGWISVKERLPNERDSIFANLFGTERWLPGLFKTISDAVIAVIVLDDGRRVVRAIHTNEGKWNFSGIFGAKEVTHWMPMPEAPKGGEI